MSNFNRIQGGMTKRIIEQSAFDILELARQKAEQEFNSYITPEHVLFQIEASGLLTRVLCDNHLSPYYFRDRLNLFLGSLKPTNATDTSSVQIADNLRFAIDSACDFADLRGDNVITIPHLLVGIAGLKDSLAGYLLSNNSAILERLGQVR